MPNFPIFLDLENQNVLVVGGGRVAERKVCKLLPYGPKITVVAPEICESILALSEVTAIRRRFRLWDLYPRPAMVIAATDDSKFNEALSRLCKKRRIPVNVVDSPANCSFLFPALVRQGDFSAGICTGGCSPTVAAHYKEEWQAQIPENLGEVLAWLEDARQALKETVPAQARRAAVLRELADACLEKGRPLGENEKLAILNGRPLGRVTLVGAGCGKADLITVRGLRALKRCQAVVYDDLIDPALLDAAPESAQRIYMGKRLGAHSAPQEEINQKLIELAQSGLDVVRLKGGDPYLFGRGGEEMLALDAAGVPCTEIPGIPSAFGIPAESGIPVTHRGKSQGVHIVTAHVSDTPDGLPENLQELAKLPGTLVFLMGLSKLPEIAQTLMAAGKDPQTPCAVLSGGNSLNPKTVRAPLKEIAGAAKEVTAPAIILVGQVAEMNLGQKS